MMAPALPRVYIVTLNWNGAEDTIGCVESLRQLESENFRIVICDNDSSAESVSQLIAWGATLAKPLVTYHAGPQPDWPQGEEHAHAPDQITLIHTGGNLGYAGGMNVGIRFALDQGDADFVWILNNDTAVAPDALRRALERIGTDDQIGICGSTLVYFGNRDKVQALGGASYDPWRARSRALGAFSRLADAPKQPEHIELQMAYVVGAAMLVSRTFIDRVGLMDESYFLFSEEHDWAHRGVRMGFRLAWAPESLVYHKHGATIGTSPSGGSELSLFYLYRNKALFTAKHYPWLLPVALPALVWACIKLLLRGQWHKAWAAFSGLLAMPRRRRFRS
jgi:GT2 family glycosyltransferase